MSLENVRPAPTCAVSAVTPEEWTEPGEAPRCDLLPTGYKCIDHDTKRDGEPTPPDSDRSGDHWLCTITPACDEHRTFGARMVL